MALSNENTGLKEFEIREDLMIVEFV